eukprot:3941536-Rhodomonas_salina.2
MLCPVLHHPIWLRRAQYCHSLSHYAQEPTSSSRNLSTICTRNVVAFVCFLGAGWPSARER